MSAHKSSIRGKNFSKFLLMACAICVIYLFVTVPVLSPTRMREALDAVPNSEPLDTLNDYEHQSRLYSLNCTVDKLHFNWNYATPEKHKLGIVVPFRNRENELDILVEHMEKFLENQNVEYQFWVVNQVDEYRFNRGQLLNIGVQLAKEAGCDYVVLHDVDLLPSNDELDYKYPKERGIYHVSAPGLHPLYSFSKFFGGIIKCKIGDFAKVNGFSNEFWGWGKEDDDFRKRVLEANIPLTRPPELESGQESTFKHVHGEEVERDKERSKEQTEMFKVMRVFQGYNTTRYESICIDQKVMYNSLVNFADVSLYCNHKETPWCQPQ